MFSDQNLCGRIADLLGRDHHDGNTDGANDLKTQTPIRHVIVSLQENVSLDHCFGTYPHAKPNYDGSIFFVPAKDDTPRTNTLDSTSAAEAVGRR